MLLVMPLADGALAATPVPMSEAEVVPVLVDLATGLQDLHSIGIIHRDLGTPPYTGDQAALRAGHLTYRDAKSGQLARRGRDFTAEHGRIIPGADAPSR